MKAAELLTRCLEAAEIKYVFALPGEENLAFLEALRNSTIQVITVRDEQTAVFMAATVGRLTGRVGVALATLGPGATNLVTGVAYAQLGGMPLLVITGQKPIKKSKQGKFQIIDVVHMMKPLTKLAETIVSADRIPTLLYQAIRMAETERPGAVHLEFPEDIAEEQTDLTPIAWQKIRRPVADDKSMARAVEAIKTAKTPLVLIAAAANRKLVRKQLRNFVDKTGVPFVTTQMGKGVEDESLPGYLGTTALSSDDFVHRMLEKADVILVVGHDISEKPPVIPQDGHTLIHINFYPADIDDVYTPAIEVVGDISHSLWSFAEQIEKQDHWDFAKLFELKDKLKQDIEQRTTDPGFPIKPQRLVKELREVMPKDGILSLDNGMYKLWIARNYPAFEQNTVLLDNALATMGAGLASGMAAKLLNPDKKVVVVAGDGGFVMNMADLETAKRLNLDLVVLILNDNGYGMIKWKQESMGLTDFGLSFSNPDFIKLAESFGVKGYRITSSDQFKPTLQSVIDSTGIHIIDVPIDYSENASAFGVALKDKTLNL